jgi:DNA repair protein RecO
MHHIHHTDAFVLGHLPKGEDSKILILYTRELGLVYAHAQGIRKLSSKLRFILQDFSRASVDLVRGREVWRLTSASPLHTHSHIRRNRENEKIMARISALLIRLVAGEEANKEVFDVLVRTYALLEASHRTDEQYRALELLSVARILIALGYLSRGTPGVESESLFETDIPNSFADIEYQHKLIRDINMALAASQL